MKLLSRFICWLCLIPVIGLIILRVSHGNYALGCGRLMLTVPFASTLAAFHFGPKRALSAMALISNGLMAFAFAFFALEMLLVARLGELGQVLMVAIGAAIGCINMYAVWASSRDAAKIASNSFPGGFPPSPGNDVVA